MELSWLKIENYRGIEKLEIDLEPSTVLIGVNSIGKTSVLRAIDTVLGRYTGRGGRIQDYDHRRKDANRDLPDGHQVTITATFVEHEDRPWKLPAAQALNDAIQLDEEGRRSIIARLRDTYDGKSREFEPEFVFLNSEGDPLPIRLQEQALREFVPAFYLSSERSAGSDFRSGARFWAPFLRDPTLDKDERRALETKLREVGAAVKAASPGLAEVRNVMEGARGMIELNEQDPVSLEPLPATLSEVLRQTEVRFIGPTGASVALDLHGGGAQNVAVLYLFQAYLNAALTNEYAEDATPVLALEEPEAHLHPAATRASWKVLSEMKGQKVIATHSGELLSLVPLSSIRRMTRAGSEVEVRRVEPDTLTKEEERKVDFHIRRTRGELLFGDVWLMAEGESEYWVISGAAEALGIDLEGAGLRVVECLSQSGGPSPLIRVADDLGIAWHCFFDEDDQGKRSVETVQGLLGSRDKDAHLTMLGYPRIEHLLCNEGFGKIYFDALDENERADLPPEGDAGYWSAVADKIKNKRKVRLAVEAADQMRATGEPVPGVIERVLKAALKLKSR